MKVQRAAGGVSAVSGEEKEEDSRRWREPNPLSIRHVWLYMKRVDERQFEWYRDNKNLLPPQNIISEAVFCCTSVPRSAFACACTVADVSLWNTPPHEHKSGMEIPRYANDR